jgi:hypothetical protein
MTYEQLSNMYELNDPKLWSLLEDNPSYGPGNPNWEYDRLRDDAYDLTEADLFPDDMVSEPDDEV